MSLAFTVVSSCCNTLSGSTTLSSSARAAPSATTTPSAFSTKTASSSTSHEGKHQCGCTCFNVSRRDALGIPFGPLPSYCVSLPNYAACRRALTPNSGHKWCRIFSRPWCSLTKAKAALSPRYQHAALWRNRHCLRVVPLFFFLAYLTGG